MERGDKEKWSAGPGIGALPRLHRVEDVVTGWFQLFKNFHATEKCRIIKNSVQGKAARFIQHLPVSGES